jgi:NTE family protein
LEKFVDEILKGKTFKDLDMDFKVIATDLLSRSSVVFDKEKTPDVKLSFAIRCSLGIPLIFKFKILKNLYLVDGMFSSNYPLDIFEDNHNIITIGFKIGSNVPTQRKQIKKFGLFEYLYLLLDSLVTATEKEHIQDAFWAKTICIDVENISPIDFSLTKEEKEKMFQIGYDTVTKELERKNLI